MESKLEGAGKGVGRKLIGSGMVVGWKSRVFYEKEQKHR